MRYRELDQLMVSTGSVHHSWTCQNNGNVYRVQDSTYDWVNGTLSQMTDAGSNKDDEHRTRYLDHCVTHIESFETDFKCTRHPAAYPCTGSYLTYAMKGRFGPGYHFRGSPWKTDQNAIGQACFEALQFFESGCVDQETLLANFAWELPDVRSLWPTFKVWFTGKTRKDRDLYRRIKDARRDVKNASSTYLAYQFGVLPLIGDLIRIYDNLTKLDDHVKWLREHSGKPVKVEFRKSLPTPNMSGLSPVRPTSPPSTPGHWRKIVEIRAGLKAWAVVEYDVSELSDLSLRLKTLQKAFGLNNPAGIIWEAIPYSFVVDWVTNVGSLVDRLAIPFKLPMVITDCGVGTWTESVIEDMYTAYGETTLLRRTKIRDYTRRPGLKHGTFGLSLDGLSAKQITLGLALMGQKF